MKEYFIFRYFIYTHNGIKCIKFFNFSIFLFAFRNIWEIRWIRRANEIANIWGYLYITSEKYSDDSISKKIYFPMNMQIFITLNPFTVTCCLYNLNLIILSLWKQGLSEMYRKKWDIIRIKIYWLWMPWRNTIRRSSKTSWFLLSR